MVCPTCDGTMALCGILLSNDRIFHCGRCGKMFVDERTGEPFVHVPQLVERCRRYERECHNGIRGTDWEGFGIAESIHTPAVSS